MKKSLFTLLLLSCALLQGALALASPLKVYVAEFNAVGAQNRDEMKATLQTLLASRLNGASITTVAVPAGADAIVTGTYIVIGKVFSVDALAKTPSGATLTRAFVQGESQDELIPAIGTLAGKLSAELAKHTGSPDSVVSTPIPVKSDLIRNEPHMRSAPTTDIIRPAEMEKGNSGSGWISKRLIGAYNLLAVGETLSDGSRTIFMADDRRLSCYRQGSDMTLVAEATLGVTEKIVSLDVLGADIYLSVIRSDELSSQVWQMQNGKLVQVANGLPWFFRVFSLAGAEKKLYVQSMGRDADFYGDVFEAARNAGTITTKSPVKMPRFGDLYSFNQFRDNEGKLLTVVLNPDNYLIVYDQELNELWRSNDKFGGSELFFQKEDLFNVRTTGSKYRSVFLNQKVQVTSKNEVLVGKNDGFWVLGDVRSYKKGAVYCLAWNGSSLDEKWRTRETQNYMPDYWYDEARKELLMMQVVQRPTNFGSGRGASSLSIKKAE